MDENEQKHHDKDHISLSAIASPPDENDWLITYTDLVTLLITLFVLLVAHSTFGKHLVEEQKDVRVVQNMDRRQGTSPNIRIVDFSRSDQKDAWGVAIDELQEKVDGLGLGNDIVIEEQLDHVSVRIQDNLLFESGSAHIEENGIEIIKSVITPIISAKQYNIDVEGHTDNVPISTRQYPSNWELSASRTIAVAKELLPEGEGYKRIRVIAYGETQPISPNHTNDGRKRNRRVEIVLRKIKP